MIHKLLYIINWYVRLELNGKDLFRLQRCPESNVKNLPFGICGSQLWLKTSTVKV
jgi:hypothetical protein